MFLCEQADLECSVKDIHFDGRQSAQAISRRILFLVSLIELKCLCYPDLVSLIICEPITLYYSRMLARIPIESFIIVDGERQAYCM